MSRSILYDKMDLKIRNSQAAQEITNQSREGEPWNGANLKGHRKWFGINPLGYRIGVVEEFLIEKLIWKL